jgi:hypothetical protein
MAQDTKQLVRQYRKSGLTRKQFCARKGISVSALQYHLGKERRVHVAGIGEAAAESTPGHFVRVDAGDGNRRSRSRTVMVIRGEFGREELCELMRALGE